MYRILAILIIASAMIFTSIGGLKDGSGPASNCHLEFKISNTPFVEAYFEKPIALDTINLSASDDLDDIGS